MEKICKRTKNNSKTEKYIQDICLIREWMWQRKKKINELGDESIGPIQSEIVRKKKSDGKNEDGPIELWNNFNIVWVIIFLDRKERGRNKQKKIDWKYS